MSCLEQFDEKMPIKFCGIGEDDEIIFLRDESHPPLLEKINTSENVIELSVAESVVLLIYLKGCSSRHYFDENLKPIDGFNKDEPMLAGWMSFDVFNNFINNPSDEEHGAKLVIEKLRNGSSCWNSHGVKDVYFYGYEHNISFATALAFLRGVYAGRTIYQSGDTDCIQEVDDIEFKLSNLLKLNESNCSEDCLNDSDPCFIDFDPLLCEIVNYSEFLQLTYLSDIFKVVDLPVAMDDVINEFHLLEYYKVNRCYVRSS